MNRNRTNGQKKKYKYEYIILFLCVIVILIVNNIDKEESEEIYNNPEFSIGTITRFVSSTPSIIAPKLVNQPGQGSVAHFKFYIDTVCYEMTQGQAYYKYTPSKGVEIGEKYLVIYNRKEPKMCRILFDCPICDSSDFSGYLDNKEKILADKKHNELIKPEHIEKDN